MFDFVRSHNRILQIGLGLLIIPTFGFFGIQSYMQGHGDEASVVASVDGHDITRAEWDARHRQDVEKIREQHPQVDVKLLETPEARRQSLDGIVRDRVMLAAAMRENLTPTPESVDAFVRYSPDFAEYRALPPAQRQGWLMRVGLTDASARQWIADRLLHTQPVDGVTSSGFMPATATNVAADAWLNQREIQWQRFDVKSYEGPIQPTDAQVQAYYADKSHAADFMAPEQAKIDYVVLDAKALEAQVPVTDDLLKAFYESHKTEYTAPEERRASHIQVSVAPNATPADVAKAKAKAEALLAEVRKNPASFADVAKRSSDDVGSAAQGGDLDFMRSGAIPGPFNDALFSLKQGDISNVVQSDKGFHVIELTGIRGGVTKPFDEVRAQVEDQYRLQQAQKLYAADADKFTNTVYEQPDSLQPAVDAFKLAKQSGVVTRKASPDNVGPLASQRLLDAVFASDSLHNKHNTEAITTGPGQLVSAHVTEYQSAHLRPLAEVHDQIVGILRAQAASAAAKKDGEARVAEAKKDPSIQLGLTTDVGRGPKSADVPREITEAALKADITKGPTVVGVPLADGGYAAVRVVKSIPHAAPAADPLVAQFGGQLANAYEEAEADTIYNALKARFKVKYDDSRIARATDGSASAPN